MANHGQQPVSRQVQLEPPVITRRVQLQIHDMAILTNARANKKCCAIRPPGSGGGKEGGLGRVVNLV